MRDNQNDLYKGDSDFTNDPRQNRAVVETSPLDVIGELSARMKRLEAMMGDLKDFVQRASESQGFDIDHAKVNHVMSRFFHHDAPIAEAVEPPRPKFDAFTGRPLD